MTAQTCRYAWCAAHEEAGDNGEPTHTSRTTTVTVPDGSDGGVRPMPEPLKLLSADLFYDECYVEDSLAIWIASALADELVLDRAQAEKLADDLEVFVRDLRALAAHLPAGEAK
ncbi:DUF6907 domain-containing protein [Streptomyces sp. NBC_01518]|uniref:DUF6907 domain-containing protein n=1 Tax=Streptomyces sp. NBC_01518 TaxID=2903891 RepID=UPI0038708CCE